MPDLSKFKATEAKNKILYIIIGIWILISIFDVGYNSLKFISDAKIWLPLNNTQKKQLVYGDIINAINYLQLNSKNNSKILFISKDIKTLFLGRYFLYPREIVVVPNLNGIVSKDTDYVVVPQDFKLTNLLPQNIKIVFTDLNWRIIKLR